MTVVSTVALSLPGAGSGWTPPTVTRCRSCPCAVGLTVNSMVQLSPRCSFSTAQETYPPSNEQPCGVPGGLTRPNAPNVAAVDRRASIPTSVAVAGPLLLTATVYVSSSPTRAGFGLADIVTATSLEASVRICAFLRDAVNGVPAVRITAGETARHMNLRGSPLPSAGTVQIS